MTQEMNPRIAPYSIRLAIPKSHAFGDVLKEKNNLKTKSSDDHYHSFTGPNVCLARLQMELCRAANIFAAR